MGNTSQAAAAGADMNSSSRRADEERIRWSLRSRRRRQLLEEVFLISSCHAGRTTVIVDDTAFDLLLRCGISKADLRPQPPTAAAAAADAVIASHPQRFPCRSLLLRPADTTHDVSDPRRAAPSVTSTPPRQGPCDRNTVLTIVNLFDGSRLTVADSRSGDPSRVGVAPQLGMQAVYFVSPSSVPRVASELTAGPDAGALYGRVLVVLTDSTWGDDDVLDDMANPPRQAAKKQDVAFTGAAAASLTSALSAAASIANRRHTDTASYQAGGGGGVSSLFDDRGFVPWWTARVLGGGGCDTPRAGAFVLDAWRQQVGVATLSTASAAAVGLLDDPRLHRAPSLSPSELPRGGGQSGDFAFLLRRRSHAEAPPAISNNAAAGVGSAPMVLTGGFDAAFVRSVATQLTSFVEAEARTLALQQDGDDSSGSPSTTALPHDTVVTIRCDSRSFASATVADAVRSRLTTGLNASRVVVGEGGEEAKSSFHNSNRESSTSSITVVILDRGIDLTEALGHWMSYEGCIDDLFGPMHHGVYAPPALFAAMTMDGGGGGAEAATATTTVPAAAGAAEHHHHGANNNISDSVKMLKVHRFCNDPVWFELRALAILAAAAECRRRVSQNEESQQQLQRLAREGKLDASARLSLDRVLAVKRLLSMHLVVIDCVLRRLRRTGWMRKSSAAAADHASGDGRADDTNAAAVQRRSATPPPAAADKAPAGCVHHNVEFGCGWHKATTTLDDAASDAVVPYPLGELEVAMRSGMTREEFQQSLERSLSQFEAWDPVAVIRAESIASRLWQRHAAATGGGRGGDPQHAIEAARRMLLSAAAADSKNAEQQHQGRLARRGRVTIFYGRQLEAAKLARRLSALDVFAVLSSSKQDTTFPERVPNPEGHYHRGRKLPDAPLEGSAASDHCGRKVLMGQPSWMRGAAAGTAPSRTQRMTEAALTSGWWLPANARLRLALIYSLRYGANALLNALDGVPSVNASDATKRFGAAPTPNTVVSGSTSHRWGCSWANAVDRVLLHRLISAFPWIECVSDNVVDVRRPAPRYRVRQKCARCST